METPPFTTFQDDLSFLNRFTEMIVLQEPGGQGKIALSAALQGRVMTSTAGGDTGRSFGWINRERFEAGDTLPHINAYGGEERLWLGPEGGQFSIFFAPGTTFDLEAWQTPRAIDLDPWQVVSQSPDRVTFSHSTSLTNYSDFTFACRIERTVDVLTAEQVWKNLELPDTLRAAVIAYQSTNTLTNTGEQAWQKETGLLSIWMLGMFNPSPTTTIVVPFHVGEEEVLGPIVNDDYFGKVPADRLKVGKGVLYFSGDGQYRSKIGLPPQRAKGLLGAWDAASKVLTLVKYSQPLDTLDYVNSLWKIQDQPYRGDVANSYNDGPASPDAKPMGPFYELESSSPALALQPSQTGLHIQQTYHFEGEAAALNPITLRLLGVSIAEIEAAFGSE